MTTQQQQRQRTTTLILIFCTLSDHSVELQADQDGEHGSVGSEESIWAVLHRRVRPPDTAIPQNHRTGNPVYNLEEDGDEASTQGPVAKSTRVPIRRREYGECPSFSSQSSSSHMSAASMKTTKEAIKSPRMYSKECPSVTPNSSRTEIFPEVHAMQEGTRDTTKPSL